MARPSHVSGPSLLYAWCQVDHLCARRTDTGYTHRQSSVCMSRYQYFSLIKGGPYRPRTINTAISVVDQATSFYRGCLAPSAETMPVGKCLRNFSFAAEFLWTVPGCGLGGFPVSVRRRGMWAVLTACLPRRDPPPGGCDSLHPDHACWA